MLSIISRSKIVTMLALMGLGATLFSFAPGGEGFEIYLNNKVVMQQFGSKMDEVKKLKLDQAADNDEIAIVYHHCGKVGKNRTLTFKDAQNRIVKQLTFKDVTDAGARMTCKVKDIRGLQKGNGTLKLYYASSELPKGRQIASLGVATASVASR